MQRTTSLRSRRTGVLPLLSLLAATTFVSPTFPADARVQVTDGVCTMDAGGTWNDVQQTVNDTVSSSEWRCSVLRLEPGRVYEIDELPPDAVAYGREITNSSVNAALVIGNSIGGRTLVIDGQGATVRYTSDTPGIYRFLYAPADLGSITVRNLTIEGFATWDLPSAADKSGAGIYALSPLFLENVTLAENMSGGLGGGVFGRSHVCIRDSRFDANRSLSGGAGVHAVGNGVDLAIAGTAFTLNWISELTSLTTWLDGNQSSIISLGGTPFVSGTSISIDTARPQNGVLVDVTVDETNAAPFQVHVQGRGDPVRDTLAILPGTLIEPNRTTKVGGDTFGPFPQSRAEGGTGIIVRTPTVDIDPTCAAFIGYSRATTPEAPTLTVTAGDEEATLSWTTPADGGSPITGYTVTGTATGLPDVSCAPGTTTSCVITDLTNGTTYTFTVRASNIVGDGPASTAVPGTPTAPPLPSVPAAVATEHVPWIPTPQNRQPLIQRTRGEMQREGGQPVQLAAISSRAGEVGYVDDTGMMSVVFTGDTTTDVERGLVATREGMVRCEVCGDMTPGSIVEIWAFSTPRLVAAAVVDERGCIDVMIPLSAPLDGGPTIGAGEHTLQVILPMDDGQGRLAVNVGVTVGGLTPTSLPAGEGMPTGAAGFIGMLGAALAVLVPAMRRGRIQGAVGSA